MSIGVPCGRSYVVAGILTIAAVAGQRLVAQGGPRVRHPAGPAASASRESHVGPARSILHTFVGTWHFEIRFAGNYDGAADATGTRVVKPLFDDLRLEWVETLDHSPVQGQGIIGFDPTSGRFFSSAVYSAGSAPEFLTGILDDAEPLITFSPMPIALDAPAGGQVTGSVALDMLDENHFTWTALDRTWRAVFTRQP